MTADEAVGLYVTVNTAVASYPYPLFYMEQQGQLEADTLELGMREAFWLEEELIFGWEWA